MQNLVKNSVGILLKEVHYENVDPNENKKIEYEDKFELVGIEPDIAEFEITREVCVDLQISYKIKVVVGLQIHAKEGVDLSKDLTDEIIENNKKKLSNTVMGLISALVTQITGSFNNYPIITAPTLKLETN